MFTIWPTVVFIGSDLQPRLLADMKRRHPTLYMKVLADKLIGMSAGFQRKVTSYANTKRLHDPPATSGCRRSVPARGTAHRQSQRPVYAPLAYALAIEDMPSCVHSNNLTHCDAKKWCQNSTEHHLTGRTRLHPARQRRRSESSRDELGCHRQGIRIGRARSAWSCDATE